MSRDAVLRLYKEGRLYGLGDDAETIYSRMCAVAEGAYERSLAENGDFAVHPVQYEIIRELAEYFAAEGGVE